MVTAEKTNGQTSAPAKVAAAQRIEIPKIHTQKMVVKVVGDSPLIMNAWSEKAQRMIEDKQQKKPKQAKEARNPQAEFEAAAYRDEDGDFAIPSRCFRMASIGACRFADIKMTIARGAFFFEGEYVKIESPDPPRMRTDMVRIGMGTADIRYRPEWLTWGAELLVEFNTAILSPEQIVNLINLAGFAQGVGEFRPERGGDYGRFHVVAD